MVRRNQVDVSRGQTRPEAFPMPRLPDRRRALERGRPGRDLFGVEGQVVGTGLDRDVHAGSPRRTERRERVGRREMHDVDARAVLPAEAHQQIDGGLLAHRRP